MFNNVAQPKILIIVRYVIVERDALRSTLAVYWANRNWPNQAIYQNFQS